MKPRVLFVCLGNICRSPTAEAVFRDRLARAGLEDAVEIDSAGTGDWHVGNPPDARMQRAAAARGYEMGHLCARQVTPEDFRQFHHVLAMDEANLMDLQDIRPADATAELCLFLDFHPEAGESEVPDPYYGGPQGFDQVLDLVEAAADGLVDHLRRQHGL